MSDSNSVVDSLPDDICFAKWPDSRTGARGQIHGSLDRTFAATLGLQLSADSETIRQLIYDREREYGTLRLLNRLKTGEFLFVRKIGETMHVYRTTTDFRLLGAAVKRPNAQPVAALLRDAERDMPGEFAVWREAAGKL